MMKNEDEWEHEWNNDWFDDGNGWWMENMNEKMMEHEMDMVDGIWMDENEATNLASCLPHY